MARTRTDGSRNYRFEVRPSSTRRYRVHAAGAGLSHAFTVRVVACAAARRPSSDEAVWFSRPDASGTSQTSQGIAGLLCAAAPRSTIDIAMYFIRTRQQQMAPIVSALKRLVRYRHVKVNILLEGRLVQPGGSLRPAWRDLGTFATVHTCWLGCHNEAVQGGAGTQSIMHHKFMTISDTVWRTGADPAVLLSTANWSDSQLAAHWQSTVMLYDDRQLDTEVGLQWDQLMACASRAGCGSWAHQLSVRGLSPAHYAMTLGHHVWYPARGQHPGTAGRGTAVTWSPQEHGDPVASALAAYTCTPQHHTVRLAHMFVTGARHRVIDQLVRLRHEGCTVRVDVSQPDTPTMRTAVRSLRSTGLHVTCVPRVHDKLILLDAVRKSDGVPDRAVLMGSQSLGGNALHRNDEALFRISTAGATGSHVSANRALYDEFTRHWVHLDAHARACTA